MDVNHLGESPQGGWDESPTEFGVGDAMHVISGIVVFWFVVTYIVCSAEIVSSM